MQRVAIGAVAGLGIWLASIAVAEAQGSITPIGPTSAVNPMYVGHTGATFTASVTLNQQYSEFGVRLLVYRGANPTPFYSKEGWKYGIVGLGPHTWQTGVDGLAITFSPAAALGEVFTFKYKLRTAGGDTPFYIHTHTVTTNPGTYYQAPPDTRFQYAVHSVDRDRRQEA